MIKTSSHRLQDKLFAFHPDKENIQFFPSSNSYQGNKKLKRPQDTTSNPLQAIPVDTLKRKRDDDNKEEASFLLSDEKMYKNERCKEPACTLCEEVISYYTTFAACSDNFCNECLAEFVKYSTESPFCSKKIKPSTNTFEISQAIEPPQLETSLEIQEPPQEDIIPPMRSNPYIFNKFHIVEEAGTYTGTLFNGKKEGEGRMIYKNGSVYEGDWKDDKREGKGNLTLETGEIFKAEWTEDVMQTIVEIIDPIAKSTFKGEVQDSKKHGKGVFTCGKTAYDGFWENDKRHGWGKETDGVSYTYEGHWRNDKQHGQGVLELNNGIYDGNWINGKISGYGALTLRERENTNNREILKKDKRLFEGHWMNGEANGIGTMFYEDGVQYTGGWKDNKREGNGVLKMPNGVSIQGEWMNDKIQVKVPVDF